MASSIILNPGSTSKKFALYRGETVQLSMSFEETGQGFNLCVEEAGQKKDCRGISASEYKRALEAFLDYLLQQKLIKYVGEIGAVGVRVVAPGRQFAKHAVIDDAYASALKAREKFAPLHVPPVLEEIAAVKEVLPQAKLVAVSDSAFHQTKPDHARLYSLPKDDTDLLEIERYGYHGISVSSVVNRVPSLLGDMPERMVVAHVGGGVSLTALVAGRSIDNSMGFVPASGMMMSGRAGDLDAGALLGVLDGKSLRGVAAHTYLNNEGGFAGVSGVKDMRIILNRRAQDDKEAELAFNMYLYQFKKILGSFYAALGGLDALVFTATAVYRNSELRNHLLSGTQCLGIEVDQEKNEALTGAEGIFSRDDSQVKVVVMKTDEFGDMNRVVQTFI